jgi:hypothetical protein
MNYGTAALIGALLKQGYTYDEAVALLSRASAPVTTPEGLEDKTTAQTELKTQVQASQATATPTEGMFAPYLDNRLMAELPIPPDMLQAAAFTFLLMKDRNALVSIVKEYLKTLNSVMGHLAQAGSANLMTAYGHQLIISNILEHNYMIHSGATAGLAVGLNALAISTEGRSWLGTIFGGGGFNVPQTLIFSGVGVPEIERLKTRESMMHAVRKTIDTKPQAKATVLPTE